MAYWYDQHTIRDSFRESGLTMLHLEQDVSGGGPHALACAASMPPDRLKGVAIVCGIGLPNMSKSRMPWWNLAGLTYGYRYFPSVTCWYFSRDPQHDVIFRTRSS